MIRYAVNKNKQVSEIIKNKLYANGGKAAIKLYGGKPCNIYAENDGMRFSSDKLATAKYNYEVFDVIVNHLKMSPGFRAPKGNARNKEDKVGYGKCCEGTVVYNFATEYAGKRHGESTFDPVFVFAAILEWAGIAVNGRGYIELNPEYR